LAYYFKTRSDKYDDVSRYLLDFKDGERVKHCISHLIFLLTLSASLALFQKITLTPVAGIYLNQRIYRRFNLELVKRILQKDSHIVYENKSNTTQTVEYNGLPKSIIQPHTLNSIEQNYHKKQLFQPHLSNPVKARWRLIINSALLYKQQIRRDLLQPQLMTLLLVISSQPPMQTDKGR